MTAVAQVVQASHGDLAVHIDGDPGNGLVVLLHGLGADHLQALAFTPSAAELDSGWQRIAVDFRGHGETRALGNAETLNFAAFAEDVASVLDVTASGRDLHVVVVGMSLGAEVALQLAWGRPDLVDGLVLVRPARPLGLAPAFMSTAYEQVYECLQMGPHGKQMFSESAAYAKVVASSPPTAASLLGQFDRANAAERAPVIAAFSDLEGLELGQVGQIQARTLVLSTPQDPAHPLRCGEVLADTLPHALPLVVLPPKATRPDDYQATLKSTTGAFITAAPRALAT